MTTKEVIDAIDKFLERHSLLIAGDLAQCFDQKTATSRHLRREKALAYLIESESQSSYYRFSEQDCLDLLALIAVLKANAKSDEARVGYLRAEKRMDWLLAHPAELRGKNACVACGEIIAHNGPHECTNATARGKNSQLARDTDLET